MNKKGHRSIIQTPGSEALTPKAHPLAQSLDYQLSEGLAVMHQTPPPLKVMQCFKKMLKNSDLSAKGTGTPY